VYRCPHGKPRHISPRKSGVADMSWYYSSVTGAVYEQTGALAAITNANILVERHDPVPGQYVWGPFATEDAALAAKAKHPPLPNPVTAVGSAVTGAASSVAGQVGAYVVRILEGVAGIVILAIALNVILKQSTGVDVASSAARGIQRTSGVIKSAAKLGA
jgi:hypothetical protein